jgi:uncharacterized protein
MMKKKVAIIGGGTGLTLAWLLADQFDVTLYESSDRLGGHIQTLKLKQSDGKEVLIEAGTEFVNPEYVNFYKLLEILGMELRSYTMKMEFIDYTKKDSVANYEKTFFSPGITDLMDNYSDVDKKCCLEGCCEGFDEFMEDTSKFGNLALLQYLIYKYNKMKNNLTKQTTKEFVDSLALVKLVNPNFGPEFFYPVTTASWGIDPTNAEGTEPRNAEDYMAFYTLYYMAAGSTYQEVVGGLSKYISALHDRIKNICKIKLNSKVVKIIELSKKQYRVSHKNKLTNMVFDEVYDEVIVCTNFEIMSQLIRFVPSLKNLYNKINRVTYYTTKICIHESQDEDWDKDMIIHIKHTGKRSSLHITKPWNNNLTRSWVFKDEENPENTLETIYYRHPNMNEPYAIGQKAVREHNRKKTGISFGGICAGDSDSHKGAIDEAIAIANGFSKKYNVNIPKLNYFKFDNDECCATSCGCSCSVQ